MGLLRRVTSKWLGGGSREAEPRAAVATEAESASQQLAHCVATHQAGNLDEARVRYEAFMSRYPDNGEAMYRLGVLTHQQGDSESGAALIERAARVGFESAPTSTNLGLLYFGMGRLDAAENALRRSTHIDPGYAGAHGALGLVLMRKGEAAGAEDSFKRGLQCSPDNVEILNNLGGLFRDSGRLDAALECFGLALNLRPASIEVLSNLGGTQLSAHQWPAAHDTFRKALALDDRNARTWSALGYVLMHLGEHDDAISACRESLALQPDWPEGLANLASVLASSGNTAEAEQTLLRAIELAPERVESWIQLGAVRVARRDFAEAEQCYRRALEVAPTSARARYELGLFLMLKGDFRNGFAFFESRFAAHPEGYADEVRALGTERGMPRWRGETLAGKDLLILCEQGFGDNIMMFRYLPVLARLGARRVVVACGPELARLASEVAGVTDVVALKTSTARRGVDLACPIMSLPSSLDDAMLDMPVAPYIDVPDAEREKWRARVEARPGFRVGLVWTGNGALEDADRRDFWYSTLDPILRVPDVRLFSLQKGRLRGGPGDVVGEAIVTDLMDQCDDFLDTASLIANLDLVIAVDTAVAHLAAGMGKPTWLLAKAAGDWRWGVAGETTPWYPTMRVFRQPSPRDWASVVEQVARELARLPKPAV